MNDKYPGRTVISTDAYLPKGAPGVSSYAVVGGTKEKPIRLLLASGDRFEGYDENVSLIVDVTNMVIFLDWSELKKLWLVTYPLSGMAFGKMSKAEAFMLQAKQGVLTQNGREIAMVHIDARLHLKPTRSEPNSTSLGLSAEDALELGRWIVDMYEVK